MPPSLRIGAAMLALAVLPPAQTPDWHRLPALTGLATKRLAFDSFRERLVLFESSERGGVSRTWEWIGRSWSLRRPARTPPPRQGFAAGYDPFRARFVMFGGSTEWYHGSRLADTWEYDGIDWVQRTPTASPPPQFGGWLGPDYASGRMLLCGGLSSPVPAGAWHYDGTSWTSVTPAPFYYHHSASLATHPGRARVVALVPQTIGSTLVNSTHEWDGTVWQTIPTAQLPPPRTGAAMTFVPARGTVVLHGGRSGGPGWTYYRDTWEWNGTNWSALTVPAPIRMNHEFVHDPTRGETIVVGGLREDGPGTDTLRWDGAGWQVLDTGLGWSGQPATFDPVRGTVVVLQWPRGLEWDGARWSAMALPPTLAECTGLAYDVLRNRLVAIGPLAGVPQTWERTGTVWSAPVPAPSLTASSRLVWHGGRGRVLASCAGGGLREWDGTQWSAVPNSGGAPCTFVAPVYDPARGELVVPNYSGTTLQVHVWDGAAWTVRVPANSPPSRHADALGYDEARQRVVLFGGRNSNSGLPNNQRFFDDLWEWDGIDWSQRVLPTTPPGRESGGLVFDANRQQLLLIGGWRQEANGAWLSLSDLWALDSASPAAVAVLGAGCGAGAPLQRIALAHAHPGAPAFSLDVHTAVPSAPCLLALGGPAAPVPLGAGCNWFLPAPQHVAFLLANATGFASAAAAIPLALQGFSFGAQAAVLSVAPPGFGVTESVQITVGR